jgi:hypothetical protein
LKGNAVGANEVGYYIFVAFGGGAAGGH